MTAFCQIAWNSLRSRWHLCRNLSFWTSQLRRHVSQSITQSVRLISMPEEAVQYRTKLINTPYTLTTWSQTLGLALVIELHSRFDFRLTCRHNLRFWTRPRVLMHVEKFWETFENLGLLCAFCWTFKMVLNGGRCLWHLNSAEASASRVRKGTCKLPFQDGVQPARL